MLFRYHFTSDLRCGQTYDKKNYFPTMLTPPKDLPPLEQFEFYYRINRYLVDSGGMVKLMGIFPDRPWVNKLFSVMSVVAFLAIFIPQLYATFTQPLDMIQILESIGTQLVVVNSTGKCIVIFFYRDAITRQGETWKKLWGEIVLPEQLSQLARFTKRGKLLTLCWLLVVLITSAAYLATPVLVGFRNNFANKMDLPFLVGVEFQSNFTLFCIYLLQILAIGVLYLTVSGRDLICLVLLNHACGHLKVLQTQLRNIRKPDNAVEYSSVTQNSMASSFRKCIRRHQVILEACAELENTCNMMGLIEAMCAVWHLCLAGVAIMLVKYLPIAVPEEALKFFVHLLCALYHLLLYCWPAHDLIIESLAVADAAFCVKWYYCSQSMQIDVSIMIQRAQKSCQFTAGRFFAMSLEAYTALVSKGFSIFAVLRTVM